MTKLSARWVNIGHGQWRAEGNGKWALITAQRGRWFTLSVGAVGNPVPLHVVIDHTRKHAAASGENFIDWIQISPPAAPGGTHA